VSLLIDGEVTAREAVEVHVEVSPALALLPFEAAVTQQGIPRLLFSDRAECTGCRVEPFAELGGTGCTGSLANRPQAPEQPGRGQGGA
jgi:hypothetical protein